MITRTDVVSRKLNFDMKGKTMSRTTWDPATSPKKVKKLGTSPKKSSKGRQSLSRQAKENPNERIDLTRFNTEQYHDLLDGLDPGLGEEDSVVPRRKKMQNRGEKLKMYSIKRCRRPTIFTQGIIQVDVPNDMPLKGISGGDGGNIPKDDSASTSSKSSEQNETEIPSESKEKSESSKVPDSPPVSPTHVSSESLPGTSPPVSPTHASGENEDSLIGRDSTLDSTFLLNKDAETQTEKFKCEECSSLYQDLEVVLKKHIVKYGKQTGKSTSVSPQEVANVNTSLSSSPEKEKMATLVKGCTVRIPLSKKAALETEVPDGDPQKMTDYLLDCLIPITEQAQMTCDGKTNNSKPLPPDISACLQVFIKAKYNSKTFNFDKRLFKTFVNGKFYKARNWVRKYQPELVEQGIVRPKMKKHTKKKSDGADESVTTDKSTKGRGESRGNRNDNSGRKQISKKLYSSKRKDPERYQNKDVSTRDRDNRSTNEGSDRKERRSKREDRLQMEDIEIKKRSEKEDKDKHSRKRHGSETSRGRADTGQKRPKTTILQEASMREKREVNLDTSTPNDKKSRGGNGKFRVPSPKDGKSRRGNNVDDFMVTPTKILRSESDSESDTLEIPLKHKPAHKSKIRKDSGSDSDSSISTIMSGEVVSDGDSESGSDK